MPSAKRRPARWAPPKTPATRPPLRRMLWAIQRLQTGRPLRATDLAREFEVALRTAYRDFEFLKDDWRVPLEYDHHKGTYALTEPMAALPLVSLSKGELVAIYAEKVLRQYRGTPFRRICRVTPSTEVYEIADGFDAAGPTGPNEWAMYARSELADGDP